MKGIKFSLPRAAVRRAVEAAVDFGLGAIGAKFLEALGLAMGDGFVDLQNFERVFLGDEIVHAHDDFFFAVDFHLIAVGGFGDFALRIAAFDGSDHAAHGVDLVDVVPGAALRLRW